MVSITTSALLADPALYLPFYGKRYDTRPNLFRLGHDFGNNELDRKILQFDNLATAYIQCKQAVRRNSLDNYYRDILTNDDTTASINQFLVSRLLSEYPELFQARQRENTIDIHSSLSGETLVFDSRYHYRHCIGRIDEPGGQYRSGLDALAHQIQEDICVLSVGEQGDELLAAHLCFPNKWSPAEKIGKSFSQIHMPVARFADENRNTKSLVTALSRGGPYVRFAWGLSSDTKLDHHPKHGVAIDFRQAGDPLYIRVERQTLVSLYESGLLMFFIRTYYYDCYKICDDAQVRASLLDALESMKPDTLEYKGLVNSKDKIVNWLRTDGSG